MKRFAVMDAIFIMPEVSLEGQQKLKAARVIVIGTEIQFSLQAAVLKAVLIISTISPMLFFNSR
jgi:molybdopterin/thiamine biosynthesis adenylyltransferase